MDFLYIALTVLPLSIFCLYKGRLSRLALMVVTEGLHSFLSIISSAYYNCIHLGPVVSKAFSLNGG